MCMCVFVGVCTCTHSRLLQYEKNQIKTAKSQNVLCSGLLCCHGDLSLHISKGSDLNSGVHSVAPQTGRPASPDRNSTHSKALPLPPSPTTRPSMGWEYHSSSTPEAISQSACSLAKDANSPFKASFLSTFLKAGEIRYLHADEEARSGEVLTWTATGWGDKEMRPANRSIAKCAPDFSASWN